MGSIDGIKLLAGALSISVVMFVAAAIALSIYPQLKVLVGDLLRALGWLGKAVRRASLESELEGTLNTFVKAYNAELNAPYLPRCEVKWLTETNKEHVLQPGVAVIRVAFGEDHDQTFFSHGFSMIPWA